MGQEIYTEVPNDFPLPPGTEVMLYCEWATDWPYGRAAQWAAIEEALKQRHPDFEIISFQNQEDYLRVEVRVTRPTEAEKPKLQRAELLTGLIIATKLLILGVAIFSVGWAIVNITTSIKTGAEQKLVEAETAYAQTTTAKIEAAKWPIIAVAAAAAFIFGLIKIK